MRRDNMCKRVKMLHCAWYCGLTRLCCQVKQRDTSVTSSVVVEERSEIWPLFVKGHCLPLSNQASMMASTSPNAENQEIRILNQETPRAAPDDDLVRKLLDEVSEIRKENQQLKNEMVNLKSSAKRKLFQRPKGSDPECSVSSCSFDSKPTMIENVFERRMIVYCDHCSH